MCVFKYVHLGTHFYFHIFCNKQTILYMFQTDCAVTYSAYNIVMPVDGDK